jgi:hypothetical protein
MSRTDEQMQISGLSVYELVHRIHIRLEVGSLNDCEMRYIWNPRHAENRTRHAIASENGRGAHIGIESVMVAASIYGSSQQRRLDYPEDVGMHKLVMPLITRNILSLHQSQFYKTA